MDNNYDITFIFSNGSVVSTCTCKSGMQKKFCNHRRFILNGKVDKLIKCNLNDLEILFNFLENSFLKSTYDQELISESIYNTAKLNLLNSKNSMNIFSI